MLIYFDQRPVSQFLPSRQRTGNHQERHPMTDFPEMIKYE
jgi:hypothetical protein